MKSNQFVGKRAVACLVISALLVLQACTVSGDSVKIETKSFRYEIGKDGKNIAFYDKRNKTDYLKSDDSSYCASVKLRDQLVHASKVEALGSDELKIWFGTDSIYVRLGIERKNDYLVLEVLEAEGGLSELNFLNIPLNLNGMPDEPFAGCVLALNPFTHVRQLPALQTHLWANAYQRFNLTGAKVAILGTHPDNMLLLIQTVLKEHADLPVSEKGGAWARENKEGYGSYIMSFGGVTEETVDSWIEMCKNLGFNQIDHHGGGFFNFGELKIDSVTYPNGWADFRTVNRKLKEAGISSIFHTYAYFIDKNSKYVKPVLHPDLGYFRSFTLAKPIGENDTEIEVNESTAEVSTIIGFFVRNSVSLNIGGELVEFSGVTKEAPYKFTGCKRGAFGTVRKKHPANEKAYHLKEVYGRFIPDPDTELFREIARKTAEVVNEAEFDGIYLDAVDGGDVLGGPENFWYYPSQFIFEIVKNLKRPVGMEMASMTHFWWHYRSRWQAWDTPLRGYKRFTDIHLAAIKSPNQFLTERIKSNDFEHGIWPGDTALIQKYAALPNGSLLLPLTLGWYGNQIGVPPQTETSFSDDAEYLAAKMLGNNAGTAMTGGYDPGTIAAYPLFRVQDSIIRIYEELRHARYFDDSILAYLRVPGREFKLYKDEKDRWNFKRAEYAKQTFSVPAKEGSSFDLTNIFGEQPVKLRIEALHSVKAYNDPSSVVIAGPKDKLSITASARGVSGEIRTVEEGYAPGQSSLQIKASSTGETVRRGSWILVEKGFLPALNIEKNQGLGLWVKGDGKGAILNIRLESPKHISHGARGDRYIIIDFTGWKYFDLLELESERFTNYQWPVSDLHVYDSYRHSISFKEITAVQFWLNNIPANEEVDVLVSPVKALAMQPAELYRPSISIDGKKLEFNVRMQTGMFLEYFGADDCKLYDATGKLIQQVETVGDIPMLRNGANRVIVNAVPGSVLLPRIKFTGIVYGDSLINYK